MAVIVLIRAPSRWTVGPARAGTRSRIAKIEPVSEHVTSTTLRRRRVIAVAVIVFAGLAALALGVRATHGDRVLPGVRVEGVDLGGATREEVRVLLRATAEDAAALPVTLRRRGPARDDRPEAGRLLRGSRGDGRPGARRRAAAGRSAACGRRWRGCSSRATSRSPRRVDARQLARAVASVGRAARPRGVPGRDRHRARHAGDHHEGAALRSRGRPAQAPQGAARRAHATPAQAGRRAAARAARRQPRRRRRGRARGPRVPRRSRCGSRAPASRSSSRRAGLGECSRSSPATAVPACGSAPATQRLAIAHRRDRRQARRAGAQRADHGARLGRQARRQGRRRRGARDR